MHHTLLLILFTTLGGIDYAGQLTFLSEIAAQDDQYLSLPRTSIFRGIHVSSPGLESANATRARHSGVSHASDAGQHQKSSGYHFDSARQQTCS